MKSAEREAKTVLARFPNEPLTRQLLSRVATAEGNVQDAELQTSLQQSNWLGDAAVTPMELL